MKLICLFPLFLLASCAGSISYTTEDSILEYDWREIPVAPVK